VNCQGCGTELDPSAEQINTAVEDILESSLKDSQKKGGVCPLCGSHRKTALFGLLAACLLVSIVLTITFIRSRQTLRAEAARDAVARMVASQDVIRLLGQPITMRPGVKGEIKQDETGWQEVHLTIPVSGPVADAVCSCGRKQGSWSMALQYL